MKWVLVDLGWVLWRSLHSTGFLEYDDDPTGIIFGFFTQLKSIMLDPYVRSNRVLVFQDSRHSYRRDIYPQYKSKRTENRTPEEITQRKMIRKQGLILARDILPVIGIPVYQQKGLESDDLIASAVIAVVSSKAKGVIITADGDLWQCIRNDVSWYDPQRNLHHTPDTFFDKKGIHPWFWHKVKCLAGCKSDNVDGIRGIGEKTAVKYLNGNVPPKSRILEMVANSLDIQVRNETLVSLPHPKTKPVKLKEPQYKPGSFFPICEKYGFDSFLKDRKQWDAIFSGKMFKTRRRDK